MSIIKIKRGLKTNLPTLEIGELGYCTDTKELFIGTLVGNEIIFDASGNYTTLRAGATTKTDVGLANVTNDAQVTAVSGIGAISSSGGLTPTIGIATGFTVPTTTQKTNYDSAFSHISLTNNPHNVTATQVGLSNVTNESKTTMFTNPTFTGNVTIPTPVNATDAATKLYVDEAAEGLRTRPSVRAATTTNLAAIYDNGPNNDGIGATLTADTDRVFTNIDGVTTWAITTPRQGVLVKNQTNAAHNGRYILDDLGEAGVSPWVLKRCPLCDESDEIPGSYTFVLDGTINKGTGWVQVVNDPDTFTVGTDTINIFQFSGAGTYTAGTGLTLTGTVFAIDNTVLTTTNLLTAGDNSVGTIKYNALTTLAGQFDGGTTSPVNTTRLNYNGHFHATRFFGGIDFVTTAPTLDNTEGVKIAILATEPVTKYTGWLYFIEG